MIWTIVHWIHLSAAVAALGATIFLRMVVLPVLATMDEDARETFHSRAQRKVMMVILHSFGLLIITGMLNLARVFQDGQTSLYLALFMAKIMLVVAMFAIALFLLIPSDALRTFRARRATWLLVNVALGLTIVFLSSWLRMENQYGEREETTFFEEPEGGLPWPQADSPGEVITIPIPDSTDI